MLVLFWLAVVLAIFFPWLWLVALVLAFLIMCGVGEDKPYRHRQRELTVTESGLRALGVFVTFIAFIFIIVIIAS